MNPRVRSRRWCSDRAHHAVDPQRRSSRWRRKRELIGHLVEDGDELGAGQLAGQAWAAGFAIRQQPLHREVTCPPQKPVGTDPEAEAHLAGGAHRPHVEQVDRGGDGIVIGKAGQVRPPGDIDLLQQDDPHHAHRIARVRGDRRHEVRVLLERLLDDAVAASRHLIGDPPSLGILQPPGELAADV